MANRIQIMEPVGQEYLFEEIAKHIEQVASAQQQQQYNSSSGMSFTTGLLLGQLSVVLLVIVCFKYLLLEDVRYGRKVPFFFVHLHRLTKDKTLLSLHPREKKTRNSYLIFIRITGKQ